jgi:agmatinase
MRRLIESGAVDGRNFVQVGLRGYWPPVETFEWMKEHGLRYHFMTEVEERGAEAVVDDAIAEALDGPDAIYLSLDIDVVDPGLAPGTGTPEPGGLTSRELLRAIRRVVGQVELAAMDIVEVSPPYDHAETTAMVANRAALEAISALAVKRRDGATVRFAADAGRGGADAAPADAPRRRAARE